ncbi:EAL domain-containing protein [Paenibacillus sp. PsM32]|uniref:EAL domain-containing protein n=1 Tax=Paenibacillus kyungheensis TaxID=1452732 RepID=A0AAX3M380_9BACL|nr:MULTISPECIES: EAL domain-containing protein [Paenibacillus]MDN4619253.1 EAL domain-containing protein [Paenibacillus sp. PsM32]WCT56313.1 EAL domain-containing protein [Paenibacillus kyungheensis]
MNCSGCSYVQPIEDQGTVSLRPLSSSLENLIRQQSYDTYIMEDICSISYQSREQMLDIMHWVRSLPEEITSCVSVGLLGSDDIGGEPVWLPLSVFVNRLQHDDVVEIIRQKQFTSHMQPIVNQHEQVIAYEFLLRPIIDGPTFQPYRLFDIAHQTGLHSFLDRAARISAIETSAQYLQPGIKRFINFLPSSIYNPQYCLSHTFAAIERLHLNPKDFVFEVVETENIVEMPKLQNIFDVYRSNGISVALDDVGSGYSKPELIDHLQPDYVKIDRSLIDHCDISAEKQQKIIHILQRSQNHGSTVLAEGIERREEYDFCRSIGIELAQGYLFGKPAEYPRQMLG